MELVFELYNELTGGTVGHYGTLERALNAMAHEIQKLAPGVVRDFAGEEDKMGKLKLSFTVVPIKVK